MDVSLLTLLVMLAIAVSVAFWRGRWPLILSGSKQALLTFKAVWLRVLLGVVLGGLIQVLLPSSLIAEWIGPTSGFKGLVIGSFAGVVLTGGPFVVLPVIASIYTAGAGAGPVIAILISSGLLSLPNLITWQIPLLGMNIAVNRYILCLFVPLIVGFIGDVIFKLFGLG